ncbi:MAG: sigma-70 family RNA polymerase sigma factor [Clostridiales bacterium]|nr:sigma-70 family RNA polymerase sigma factor [Clostridiales bacterium]
MQDELLIRRAQSGDEGAFEQLLLAHQKSVYNLCLRMAGNPDDALDLSQEAFIRAWRALGQYQFDAAFSTWLFRLTSNVCIDFLRRQKRQQHMSLTVTDDDEPGEEFTVPDPAPGPEEQAVHNERRQAVARAMAALPEDYRAVMQLRAVEELSYEQIAEILDIKVGTVKSRLARARTQLRKILKDGNFFDSDSSEQMPEEVHAP